MEQLDTLLQKLGGAVLWQKIVGLVVLVVGIFGGYYFFFLDDVLTERQQMVAEQKKLTQEKGEYEERKKEYLAFRLEIAKLQEEQKDLLKLLPQKDDIEQFVENIQQQIELAGLTKVTLIRGQAQQRELHLRLPVKMAVLGNYHQIMRFIKAMGEIERLVNVEDLSLSLANNDKAAVQDQLKAEFFAVAFQYSDKGVKKPTAAAPAGMKSVGQASASGGGK